MLSLSSAITIIIATADRFQPAAASDSIRVRSVINRSRLEIVSPDERSKTVREFSLQSSAVPWK